MTFKARIEWPCFSIWRSCHSLLQPTGGWWSDHLEQTSKLCSLSIMLEWLLILLHHQNNCGLKKREKNIMLVHFFTLIPLTLQQSNYSLFMHFSASFGSVYCMWNCPGTFVQTKSGENVWRETLVPLSTSTVSKGSRFISVQRVNFCKLIYCSVTPLGPGMN